MNPLSNFAVGDTDYITKHNANNSAIVTAVTGVQTDDTAVWCEAHPANAQVLLRRICVRNATWPTGLGGSQGYAVTPATANTSLRVFQNGVLVATADFAAGSNTCTFTCATPVIWKAADRMDILNAAATDATIAGISLTFVGTR